MRKTPATTQCVEAAGSSKRTDSVEPAKKVTPDPDEGEQRPLAEKHSCT
jgi:hypothetical protein